MQPSHPVSYSIFLGHADPSSEIPGSINFEPNSNVGCDCGSSLQVGCFSLSSRHLTKPEILNRVTHLGPASLSWVRLSGPNQATSHLTVLTSGTTLFSSSPRLALLHHEESPDWTLQITGVVLRDGGVYECQVKWD